MEMDLLVKHLDQHSKINMQIWGNILKKKIFSFIVIKKKKKLKLILLC